MKRLLAAGITIGLLTVAFGAIADEAPAAVLGARMAAGSGYASAVRLAHGPASDRGRILLVFEQNGMGGIPLWESRDDGDHWHFLSNITDQKHAADPRSQLRWQPQISEMARSSGELAAGTLLMTANATGNDQRGQVISEDLQLYASTDEGRSWRYRGSIIEGGGRPEDKDNKGVWEANIHILDDGRMVAYYSSEQHKIDGYNQVLAHKLSTDGGRSWGQEALDVAIPGGVERPGMAIVERLPDHRYAMTYENIDGPENGQAHIKFSRDGLDWGDPRQPGAPVVTSSGAWPAACPVIRWLPLGGAEGVLVVSAERAGGGGDEEGHALYWNNASGRGPWWEMPAPVQKRTGNIHAGWTQEILLRNNGSLLHITSSSAADAPTDVARNEILFRSAVPDFNRYEAEDAARAGAVAVPDRTASNGRKARLGAGPGGRLRFPINTTAGTHLVRVRYADLGLPGEPGLTVNGAHQLAPYARGEKDGWRTADWSVPLTAGFNTLDIDGGANVLDIDYLQLGDDTTTNP